MVVELYMEIFYTFSTNQRCVLFPTDNGDTNAKGTTGR